ncbi:MAG: TonB-dependent receptor, partial [Deltaproteobacteria bacterium]|nr:TonB-dependent receptor [Deltaproteobacteria bacterium]
MFLAIEKSRLFFYLRTICVVLVCTLFLFIQNGFAADGQMTTADAQQPVDESYNDFILEDTVVTATKTGETRLQETPISITAFDPEILKAGGVDDFVDIEKKTPNLAFYNAGAVSLVYIRGIGNNGYYVGGQESVAFYLDDVYTSRTTGFWNAYLDVDRIEVLRGPQGTLYGRNTSGGAIRVFTGMPTDEISGFVTGEYGTGCKYDIQGAIGGPIVENKLKARIAFLKGGQDGYIDNIAPGGLDTVDFDDEIAFRAKLQFTPAEKIDILLTGDYSQREFGTGNMGASAYTQFIDAGAVPYDLRDEVAINDYPDDTVEAVTKGMKADITFNLPGNLTLRSITAYRELDGDGATMDYDGTTLDIFTNNASFTNEMTSQEFQLNGESGALTWVGGVYYVDEFELNDVLLDLRMITPYGYLPVQQRYDDAQINSESWAAYVSGTYALTDRFSATLGLRYTSEEKDVKRNNGGFLDVSSLYGSPVPIWMGTPYIDQDDGSWSSIDPKVAASYRLSEDIFLFGS